MSLFSTDLSLKKSWGPIGGLRQRRGHCIGPLMHPLPRSPQVGEEEEESVPQTLPCPRVEEGEGGRGCPLLKEKKSLREDVKKRNLKSTREKQCWSNQVRQGIENLHQENFHNFFPLQNEMIIFCYHFLATSNLEK